MHYTKVSFSVSLNYAKLLNKFIYDKLNKYFIIQKNGGEWIYISYLVKPLKRSMRSKYFNAHQNLREAIIIAEVMKELNLSFVWEQARNGI